MRRLGNSARDSLTGTFNPAIRQVVNSGIRTGKLSGLEERLFPHSVNAEVRHQDLRRELSIDAT
ncbi:MAG: hypothetical protein OXH52_08020 [Gammaproteobacteria bacterium]|nr:hypothetical protein [Gammaproteobacteria bacterium]